MQAIFMLDFKLMKNNENTTKCPIAYALDIVGDRWSLLILRDLLFKKKNHYGEFLNSAEKISTNILASRLLKLEKNDLITKQRDRHNLSKFTYQLTNKGKALLPVILDMIEWSVKYNPQANVPDNIITGAPANLLTRLHENRETLINEILAMLENN